MKGTRNIVSAPAGALLASRISASHDSLAEIASAQAALEYICRRRPRPGTPAARRPPVPR